MKNITLHKPSQRTSIIIVLVILLLALPLTLYQSQLQQIFRQFAWQTNQTATAVCSPINNNIVIKVQFSNLEQTKDINVIVRDLQTGKSVDLGTVKHGESKGADIDTELPLVSAGSVMFTLTWADGSQGQDEFSANYSAVESCLNPTPTTYAPTGPACPANVGYCRWDPLAGAVDYKVVVKDASSGSIVKEETVKYPVEELGFTMESGKAYTCDVSPINACGVGQVVTSPEKVCQVYTTPTPPYCPAEPNKEQVCVWDPLDGATEYKVDIIDVVTNENIKSEVVKHPTNSLVYPSESGKTYKCSVVPVSKCTQGEPKVSEPKTCAVPSGTPYPSAEPSATPYPSATPTVPVPTETPAPTPTVTPYPSATPAPTSTPMPTPTRKPTPTIKIVQQPPRVVQQPGQTVVQRGGVRVVQQPGQTVVQQQPNTVVQVTPGPTVAATGDNNLPVIAGGATLIMALVGAILFFAL